MLKRMNWFHLFITIAFLAICVAFFLYYDNLNASKKNAIPVITITAESDNFLSNADDDDFLEGVTAIDAEDGNVTDSLIIESKSAFIGKSKRIITYVAFDNSNHVTKYKREITYTDYAPPVINIEHELVFERGTSSEILKCFSATDKVDGDITDMIKIVKSQVVEGVEGIYPVTLSVTNSCGDTTIETRNITIKKPVLT